MPPFRGDVRPLERDGPTHQVGESEDGFHHGGLTGPVRTDDGDVLAVGDVEVDVGEDLEVAVPGVEAADLKQRVGFTVRNGLLRDPCGVRTVADAGAVGSDVGVGVGAHTFPPR
jgi:hypothetical protein